MRQKLDDRYKLPIEGTLLEQFDAVSVWWGEGGVGEPSDERHRKLVDAIDLNTIEFIKTFEFAAAPISP